MVDEARRPEEDTDEPQPLEDVGPQGCDATVRGSEKRVGDLSLEHAQDAESNFADEIAEAFPLEEIPMVPHPIDGLPAPATEGTKHAYAAPFTYDHVICVEDDREFVEVFEEELGEFASRYGRIVERLANLKLAQSRFNANGVEQERRTFKPEQVVRRYGHRVVLAESDNDNYQHFILVRPLREACAHYKRQVTANDDVPDEKEYGHRIVFRNCTKRRSVGGAFMGLRDEAIYACDYREPPHPESVRKYLDDPDRVHLGSDAYKRHLPMFGIT